jgi:glycosyltransferase involved in cell wall biosynthesis
VISAVVLTKNEERNIGECLKTLGWCDEVVIVDDYSEDKTITLIQKLKIEKNTNLKCKIFRRRLAGDFAGQRNFGLEKARGEWVLFVDADERVTAELAKETQEKVKESHFDGFYLKRRDRLYKRELRHGETARVRLLRLVKKGSGRWEGKVHERFSAQGGSQGILENPLRHYPHQNLTRFLEKVNFYSTLRAEELRQQGMKSNLGQIIFYPVGKFVYDWLVLGGIRDGMPGMIVAVMMSFHAFLVRAKLWLLTRQG